MPIYTTYLKLIVGFIAFLAIFSIMQFVVPNIIGFDGYYHIKAAEIIKKQGFVNDFQWATHTILSNNYADIQVLFRILLVPFTFFGLTLGAKLSSILFSAICFGIFYWFLAENKIKYAFFWSLLYLFASESLMYRFLLAREMPLAIAFLILTIYFLQKKKYLFLGISSFVFVLFYSGFVFQLGIIALYFILERIFSKKFDYKLLLYPALGSVLGLITNPYFPNNIFMLYTQIFRVNLIANLYNVEWKPWPLIEFVKNNIIVLSCILASAFILVKNKKIETLENSLNFRRTGKFNEFPVSRKLTVFEDAQKPSQNSLLVFDKMQLFYLSLTLLFLFYTLLSQRMQEYLVPFSVLALAFMSNGYIEGLEKNNFLKYAKGSAIAFIIILASINFVLLRKDVINNDFLYRFNGCAEWMEKNIPKDSLVFTNAYAFPFLFFKNSGLRYTHGIDLTYSYLYNPEEFERYMGILQGTLKGSEDYIIDDYKPDYVFSGKLKQDVQLFNYIVSRKENYKPAYEDEWCAVLRVK